MIDVNTTRRLPLVESPADLPARDALLRLVLEGFAFSSLSVPESGRARTTVVFERVRGMREVVFVVVVAGTARRAGMASRQPRRVVRGESRPRSRRTRLTSVESRSRRCACDTCVSSKRTVCVVFESRGGRVTHCCVKKERSKC